MDETLNETRFSNIFIKNCFFLIFKFLRNQGFCRFTAYAPNLQKCRTNILAQRCHIFLRTRHKITFSAKQLGYFICPQNWLTLPRRRKLCIACDDFLCFALKVISRSLRCSSSPNQMGSGSALSDITKDRFNSIIYNNCQKAFLPVCLKI